MDRHYKVSVLIIYTNGISTSGATTPGNSSAVAIPF